MQTSTIRYRVADFLKEFPPFHLLAYDDLLELAAAGRVRFHSDGEIVFEQGDARKPLIWVIQQGSATLYEEVNGSEEISDILGEGDLLGIGGFTGAATYLSSARAVGDLLLYAFRADVFTKIVEQYPAFESYVKARYSVRPGSDGERVQRSGDAALLASLAAQRLLTCSTGATVAEVAQAMQDSDTEAAVVTDAAQCPLGIVTWRELREVLAQGWNTDQPAASLALPPRTAQPALPMGTYQLQMMSAPGGRLVITADGTAASPAIGTLSAADLSIVIGINPALFAQEARRAKRPADLAPFVARAKILVAQTLTEHHRAEWSAQVAGEFNETVLRRLVTLAEQELAESEPGRRTFRYCWMFAGTAGRRELLTWVNPGIAVVFEDLPEAEEQRADIWLRNVRQRVDEGLRACGFHIHDSGSTEEEWLLPSRKWRARFEGWITAPLENRIYTSRPYFDLRAVAGDAVLVNELRESVHALLAEHPGFLQLLANDCLSKLPPLTFYKGLVVEDGGAKSESLDLRQAVILPLVDAARVFGLRWGAREPGVWERFAAAEGREPGQERLFASAREAYRIALSHRGRLGLAVGDAGSVINPSSLSKVDQQILKGAFRTIVALLNYTVEAFDLGGEEG